MNVALIDNDKIFNEMFKTEMKKFDFSYRYFCSYEEFKKGLKNGYDVDILLLDIEMPNKNGFEIAKELEISKPNINIFYLTEHSELIYDSFGRNISGFFPKSFLKIQKELIIMKINEAYNQNNFLPVKTGKDERRIRFINIAYIEKIKKSVVLFTVDGQELITNFTSLYELKELLPSTMFSYINRSVIININQVQSIGDSYLYLMKNNRKFDISRGQYKKIKQDFSLL